MDIYIKPVKKSVIKNGSLVKMKDLMEVTAPANIKDDILNIILFTKKENQYVYLVSITAIVAKITAKYPSSTVSNLGETDIIVEFQPDKKPSRVFEWLKVLLVICILVTGSSTAIMGFHSDAQITKIFQNYNKIFLGKEVEKPLIIEIPYAFGLATGIIVFFNHFAGKKITKDPTPIEVEMSLYEEDVNNTIIDNLNQQNKKEE